MASFMFHLSLHTGPATYCSRKRLTYAMSSGPQLTRGKAIVLSLKNSQGKIALELSGKQLRFSGWDQLTRKCGSVQIPVTKAAAVEPSSASAEEDPHLPILLYLDWYLFSTVIYYAFSPGRSTFTSHSLIAQLAVGVTLCIMNWSLGFHKHTPINKDLLTVIAPVAFFHTIVRLLFNYFLNSEVVRPVSLINKVLEPFYATLGYWIFRGSAAFGFWIFNRADPHFLLKFWLLAALTVIGTSIQNKQGRTQYGNTGMHVHTFRFDGLVNVTVDSTNVYAYTSIISLFFCIPFALHMEGPTMQYQFSRAIAKKGMVTILYDFLLMGVLYYRCNKVATENLRRVDPVVFTVGIIFEYVCATLYSNY